MSHPVYLSSTTLPRMPEGSRNEWRGFFGDGAELEANAFFPLFWRALFSADDIRHARFIDEYDIDDEASAVDREECLDDFGAEATYPYLVADQATALARLATRREALLTAIGERYRPMYEAFETLMVQHFPDHILLRTQGLPDAADAEPWLRSTLAELDDLQHGQALSSLLSDLAQQDADPVWTLAGVSSSPGGPWPTAALREHFPDPRQRRARKTPQPTGKHDPERAAPTPQPKRGFDPALEWMAAIVAAGAGLGVYALTCSAWLGVLAFLCAAGASGFGIARWRGPRA
ncbi:hypothetical protein [Variovorax sp. UMC13]|uniref:hypothetical protein n=1 Tax=Variovorax sp. UMC13 TaxID=1862326 RepID=UPI0016033343|nr:hypothetical protein [Variovorax sp. UMC13]